MTTRAVTKRLAWVAVLAAVMATTVSPVDALRSPSDLRSARVPSLCGHSGGQLVDGTLPGIPEFQGHVTLDESRVAVGRFIPGKRREAAAVVTCNAGGVGHPDNILFYNANGRLVGARRLFNVTGGGRERVRNIWISKGTVHVQVVGIAQDGDVACCGTASAKLEFRWDRETKRIVTTKKRIFNERRDLRRLVRAVNNGNRTRALRFGSPGVVDELLSWNTHLSVGGCVGELDRFRSHDTPRECIVYPTEPAFFLWFVGMEPSGWNGWRATEFQWTSTN